MPESEQSIIVNYTDEEIAKMQYDAELKMMEKYNSRRDSIIYKSVKVGTGRTGWSSTKEAFNQPTGGTCLPNANSGYYWGESTAKAGTFSMRVSIGGSLVQAALSYQPGAVVSGGGFFIAAGHMYQYYTKMLVSRIFDVTQYKAYRKGAYEPESAWVFYSNDFVQVPYS